MVPAPWAAAVASAAQPFLNEDKMTVCGLVMLLGLGFGCSQPATPPVDEAAEELRRMQDEMKAAEESADEKIDWLYGVGKKQDKQHGGH